MGTFKRGDYRWKTRHSIFIISGIVGEGIHEKGIYYRPLGKAGFLMRLARWEDIKDIRINANKNKLESFKFRTATIFPDQYYNSEDSNVMRLINIFK